MFENDQDHKLLTTVQLSRNSYVGWPLIITTIEISLKVVIKTYSLQFGYLLF